MRILGILMCAALLGFGFGFLSGVYKVFPFAQLQAAKRLVLPAAEEGASQDPRHALFALSQGRYDVVMVGDSLTERGLWAEWLAPISVANRGAGGDTVQHILGRLDTIVSSDPDLVLTAFGVNDFYAGSHVDETFARYRQVIEALKTQGIGIVIQSTPQCAVSRCGNISGKIEELNSKLARFAAQDCITFIDLNAHLAGEDGLKPEYTWDGIHLNEKGYTVWIDAILPVLQSELGAQTSQSRAVCD